MEKRLTKIERDQNHAYIRSLMAMTDLKKHTRVVRIGDCFVVFARRGINRWYVPTRERRWLDIAVTLAQHPTDLVMSTP
jgi:hypothetical protein